jgi:ABC-type bacteriocin/lantibiotic exporter with double-glycine peptidase domain
MTLQSSFHRFLLLLHPNKKEVYQIYTYAIFKGIITLSLPLGIQSIINLIQGGRISSSWILLVLIVILGILFSGIMQIMQMRITENIQQRIFTKAAFDFSVRIPKVKFESIYRHYAPELMNRFFDVLTLQKGIAKLLIDFSSSSLQIIFGLVLLSLYHSFFIAFGLLLIVLAYITIAFTAPKGLSSSIQESKYKYRVAFWLEELARAKDSFKLSGKTDLHIKNTDKEVINYLKSREHHFSILKSQYIMLLAFKIVIALALLVVGGILVLDQKMNIGQFIAAEIIILLIIESTEKLMLSLETVYDVFTSLEKIGQITDLDVDSNTGSIQFFDAKSSAFSVQSKGVSYTYPGMNKN